MSAEVFDVPAHDYECDGSHGSPATMRHTWADGLVSVLPSSCLAVEYQGPDVPVDASLLDTAYLDQANVESMWDEMPGTFSFHEIAEGVYCIVGGEEDERSGMRSWWPGNETVSVLAIRGTREEADAIWQEQLDEFEQHERELRGEDEAP